MRDDCLDNPDRLPNRRCPYFDHDTALCDKRECRWSERGNHLAAIRALWSELKEAREDLEHWGAYAGEYFQEKWDLPGDLARIDAVLERFEDIASEG